MSDNTIEQLIFIGVALVALTSVFMYYKYGIVISIKKRYTGSAITRPIHDPKTHKIEIHPAFILCLEEPVDIDYIKDALDRNDTKSLYKFAYKHVVDSSFGVISFKIFKELTPEEDIKIIVTEIISLYKKEK